MLFVHRRSKSTQGIWSKSKGEGWTRFEILCSYFQFLIFNDRQPEQHHRCFVKSLKHRRNRRVPDCYFGRFTGTRDIPKINNFDVITLGRVLPSNQFRLMRNPWGNSKIDEFCTFSPFYSLWRVSKWFCSLKREGEGERRPSVWRSSLHHSRVLQVWYILG